MYDFCGLLKGFTNEDGRLKAMPSKRKLKIAVLFTLSDKFEQDREYTEKEINEIINDSVAFHDPELLRREMIAYGFLDRKSDGSSYWKPEKQPKPDEYGLDERN